MCPFFEKSLLAGTRCLPTSPFPGRRQLRPMSKVLRGMRLPPTKKKKVLLPQSSATNTNLIQRLLIYPTLATKEKLHGSGIRGPTIQQPLLETERAASQSFRRQVCQELPGLREGDSGCHFRGNFSTWQIVSERPVQGCFSLTQGSGPIQNAEDFVDITHSRVTSRTGSIYSGLMEGNIQQGIPYNQESILWSMRVKLQLPSPDFFPTGGNWYPLCW